MRIEEEVKILRKAYELLAESYHDKVCGECDCSTCIGCVFSKQKVEQFFIEKAICAIDRRDKGVIENDDK